MTRSQWFVYCFLDLAKRVRWLTPRAGIAVSKAAHESWPKLGPEEVATLLTPVVDALHAAGGPKPVGTAAHQPS